MSCSICLDNIEDIDNHKNIRKLRCGHMFHKECIDEWLHDHSTCPYCRCYINSSINVKIFKPMSFFGKSAIIALPENNTMSLTIYFSKNIFSKKILIIVDRFRLKQYMIKNFSIIIEYFEILTNNLKTLSIKFKKYHELNECVSQFNKMFEYNRKLKEQ